MTTPKPDREATLAVLCVLRSGWGDILDNQRAKDLAENLVEELGLIVEKADVKGPMYRNGIYIERLSSPWRESSRSGTITR